MFKKNLYVSKMPRWAKDQPSRVEKVAKKKPEAFDFLIKRLEKKYASNLPQLKDYLFAFFKSDPNDKLNLYHSAWSLIHNMHFIEPYDQLEVFFKILRVFSAGKCICGQDAFVIIKGLLNDDLKNFAKLSEFKELWIYFHNLINLKLNKSVFKFPDTS